MFLSLLLGGTAAQASTTVHYFKNLPVVDTLDQLPSNDFILYYEWGVVVRAKVVGDYATFAFNVPTSGNYRIKLLGDVKSNAGGLANVILDGRTIGPFDFYHATQTGWTTRSYPVMYLAAGTHHLKLRNVGRNPSSPNFLMYPAELQLEPTTELAQASFAEDEVMKTWQFNDRAQLPVESTNLSGSYISYWSWGVTVNSSAPGHYITFTYQVPKANAYELRFFGLMDKYGGQADLELNGTRVGSYDFYTSNRGEEQRLYSQILQLEAGTNRITFRVSGRDASANNYKMYLKSITLVEATRLSSLVVTGNREAQAGGTVQLTTAGVLDNGKPVDLSGATLTYASQAPGIATVDSNGLVRVLAPGATAITVTATLKGITQSMEYPIDSRPVVMEEVLLTSDQANPYRVFLSNGGTSQLTPQVVLTNGEEASLSTATVTYSSTDTTRATVSSSGVVTVHQQGAVAVDLTVSRNGQVKTGSIWVNQRILDHVAASPGEINIPAGQSMQLSVSGTLTDETAADLSTATFGYRSSDTAVATVSSSGWVSRLSGGSATITVEVTLNGVTRSTEVDVNPLRLESVAVSPASPSLGVGSTQQLSVSGTHNDGSTANLSGVSVTYTSLAPAVATVSSSGVVTALANGTAVIQVQVTSGGVTELAEATVTVSGGLAREFRLKDTEAHDAAATAADDLKPWYWGMTVRSAAVDDYAAYTLNVPASGSYQLQLTGLKTIHGGQAELSVNGSVIGGFDFYGDVIGESTMSYANVPLNAGDNVLKLRVTGRHANSADYKMYLQQVTVQ